ncbi:DUF4079 domain-containing protein [Synechococcus sp. PCC 7336]|uniref:DUF4079 domain-containing protein n=1 Tax=Synechococcus sp. PCC 7336 TaxID=195250 RepID=UPI000345008A|nr:DUF4079 domain-containing protein [Synechococcus sp. PCC 7336]
MLDLPSFMWLWQIAAWSMGLTIALVLCLAVLGWTMRRQRLQYQVAPATGSQLRRLQSLRRLHYRLGILLGLTVLELLAIGLIGTLGHYGRLGQSQHLPAGLAVVSLTVLSVWSGPKIHPLRPWARSVHLAANGSLVLALSWVSWTGWIAVQKYLP